MLSGFRIGPHFDGLQIVRRALHTPAASIQNMGVDHRRPHVAVPQQFLHRADVVAGFQKMRGERMTEAVAGRALDQTRLDHCPAHRLLQGRFVCMVAALLTGRRITPALRLWKQPVVRDFCALQSRDEST